VVLRKAREVFHILNFEIREIFDKLHGKVGKILHQLPFSAIIRKMIDELYLQIRKMINNFYLKIGKMLYDLHLSVQLDFVAGAIRFNGFIFRRQQKKGEDKKQDPCFHRADCFPSSFINHTKSRRLILIFLTFTGGGIQVHTIKIL